MEWLWAGLGLAAVWFGFATLSVLEEIRKEIVWVRKMLQRDSDVALTSIPEEIVKALYALGEIIARDGVVVRKIQTPDAGDEP